jgi:hypothetical protein
MSSLIKNVFNSYTENARTLDEVKLGIFRALDRIDCIEPKPNIRRGYVSGILTTDGRDMIETNFLRLESYTAFIRETSDFNIFSLTDIFNKKLMLKFICVPQEEWRLFWRAVIENGYITDIFMTPRWRESTGAIDEHMIAHKIKLKVHDMENSEHLLDLLRKY